MLSLSLPIRAINALTISTKTLLNSTTKCLALGGDQNCGYKSKSIESRLGIPERPKKPLTPYFRFMQEIRPSLMNVVPKLSANDLVRAMSVKWESVDEQKKAILQDAYKKDQIEYLKKRAVYDSTLTEDQKEELKQMKRDIVENRARTTQRKRVRDLGKPKRAPSPYLLFSVDQKGQVPRVAGTPYREWQSLMSKRWASTSDEAKEKYFTESRARAAKYKEELLVWEDKMVRAGHLDLVRHEQLVEPPPPKPKVIKRRKPQATAATEGGAAGVQ